MPNLKTQIQKALKNSARKPVLAQRVSDQTIYDFDRMVEKSGIKAGELLEIIIQDAAKKILGRK